MNDEVRGRQIDPRRVSPLLRGLRPRTRFPYIRCLSTGVAACIKSASFGVVPPGDGELPRELALIKRSYFAASSAALISADPQAVLGALAGHLPFALEPMQREAWRYEVAHLQRLTAELAPLDLFLEFVIPRMGRCVDAVLLYQGIIFVLKYKVGETSVSTSAIGQALGYALDLKNFHETNHGLRIVPIVVATHAPGAGEHGDWSADQIMAPI